MPVIKFWLIVSWEVPSDGREYVLDVVDTLIPPSRTVFSDEEDELPCTSATWCHEESQVVNVLLKTNATRFNPLLIQYNTPDASIEIPRGSVSVVIEVTVPDREIFLRDLLLPESDTYTFPIKSTATSYGLFNPELRKVDMLPLGDIITIEFEP